MGYRIGTVNVTSGSNKVVGVGTEWADLKNGVMPGFPFKGPNGLVYEIKSIESNTGMTLYDAYTGQTASGQPYSILTTYQGDLSQFAAQFNALLTYYRLTRNQMMSVLTGSGDLLVTDDDGSIITVRSLQKMNAALDGKANSSDVFLQKGALGTNDLNNVIGTDYQGIWWQNATANATVTRNYPVVSAGNLLVLYNSVTSYGITQIYITHVSKRIFIRSKPTSADAWTAWSEFWTSANLVKQSGPFDATQNSLLINGAWGWGGAGNLVDLTDSQFLAWARDPSNGSRVFRNNLSSSYAVRYGAGVFVRASDTWTIMTAGVASGDGVRISAGTNDGAQTTIHKVWTDKNLENPATLDTAQTIPGIKTFTNYPITTGINFRTKEATPRNIAWLRGIPGAPIQAEFFADSNNLFVRSPTGLYLLYNGLFSGSSWLKSDNAQPSFGISLGSSGVNMYRSMAGNASPVQYTHAMLASGYNAVADSNGFWKTASPVVKLFTDGTSELTSEAEGITTERLSEGVYRISGCLGLNADRAWGGDAGGIDVPMCRNKLPRLWVDYGGDEGSEQINPDGSIVIRTYHRPHPDAPAFARNEIEGYANGDPIDIPHDTFISVRVQMPEREEPKPKVMHSNVYCNTVAS